MPRNGTGTYTAPSNSWNPPVNGATATSTDWAATQADYVAALSQSVSSDGQTPMTGNLAMGNNKITGLLAGTANTDAVTVGQVAGAALLAQCRLSKSGANILLSRYNGSYLSINGTPQQIPAAGVTLAAGVVTPGTLYYIYAYMVSTVMTLEAVTTGHSTDATTGLEIKTGDATRTLVGMARPITGPAWQDTAAQRFAVSWFNRRAIPTAAFFTTGRSAASPGAFTEPSTEIRNEFLTWNDYSVGLSISGSCSNNTAGATNTTGFGVDSSTVIIEGASASGNPTGINSQLMPVALTANPVLSEGYHFVTLLGAPSSGTSTWAGGGSFGTRTSLQGLIQG